jgi:hypothetical protein
MKLFLFLTLASSAIAAFAPRATGQIINLGLVLSESATEPYRDFGNNELIEHLLTTSATSKTYLIRLRNASTTVPLTGLSLSKSGPEAADLTFAALPTSLPAATFTDFLITLTPSGSGLRDATLVLSSGNSMNGDFTLRFNFATAPVVDTDGDGLTDLAERQLAGLGFDAQIPQHAKVAALQDSGLFTPDQVHTLRPTLEFGRRQPGPGQFQLRLGMEYSSTGVDFSPAFLRPVASSGPQVLHPSRCQPPGNGVLFRIARP